MPAQHQAASSHATKLTTSARKWERMRRGGGRQLQCQPGVEVLVCVCASVRGRDRERDTRESLGEAGGGSTSDARYMLHN